MTRVIRFAKSGARNAPTLPLDAVTRTFGIFGVKRSGKTTTARVIAEGICKTGGNVVVLDPVGVWWGITREGDGRGIPGIVIGGEHADVPLEETGGELVADLAVARAYPVVVVDMKLLRKGAARRFMADFAEHVYFSNRSPLHVIFEEADRALPQAPRGMDPTLGRLIGAAEDIVKLGGSRGLGSTFVSQRMATVQKNVTEQVECLVLHAQPGPNDQKAVKSWVEANGDLKATQRVMESMASLPVGEAWVYSPAWLHLLERVRVRKPETLDTSATPTNRQREQEKDAARAPVDLDELRQRMSATVERAKANDPRELHKRIEALERELAAAQEAPVGDTEIVQKKVLVPDREAVARMSSVISEAEVAVNEIDDLRGRLGDDMNQHVERLGAIVDRIIEAKRAVQRDYRELASLPEGGIIPTLGDGLVRAPNGVARQELPRAKPERRLAAEPSGDVSGPQQKILDALAWFESIGVTMPKRTVVAAVGGVSSRSSGYRANVSTLSGLGLVSYPQSGYLALTEAGQAAARQPDAMPTRADLHRAVMGMVSRPQADLLQALIDVYPSALSREDLAEAAGVSSSSSGFRANVSKLSGFELVEYPAQGHVAAADLLFPAAALAGRR